METIGIYLLKVNIGIALLYLLYRVLLSNDTFFRLRRAVLLLIPVIAFVFPFVEITDQRPEIFSFLTPASTPFVSETGSGEITDLSNQQTIINPDKPIDYSLLVTGTYISICIILAIRFGLQLISIGRLYRQRKSDYDNDGFRLVELDCNIKPFSFWNRIFINSCRHADEELREILLHEQVHCRQHHTLDVMIYEWLCILCWANPFIWLCKAEMRLNLEHLADDNVIQVGCDKRHYQYHLLQHCNGEILQPANQFNMINFKRRIKMMNKKRNSKAGMLKYGILFPALVLSAIWTQNVIANSLQPAIKTQEKQPAPFTEQNTEEMAKPTIKFGLAQDSTKVTPPPPPLKSSVKFTPPVIKKDTTTTQAKDAKKEKIYTATEVGPQFPGGIAALSKYLNENTVYPKAEAAKGIEGKVKVRFVVMKDGSISQVEVEKSVDPSLDKEAVRVISNMPKWTPGKQDGVAVNVFYTIPVYFKLSKPKTDTTTADK